MKCAHTHTREHTHVHTHTLYVQTHELMSNTKYFVDRWTENKLSQHTREEGGRWRQQLFLDYSGSTELSPHCVEQNSVSWSLLATKAPGTWSLLVHTGRKGNSRDLEINDYYDNDLQVRTWLFLCYTRGRLVKHHLSHDAKITTSCE